MNANRPGRWLFQGRPESLDFFLALAFNGCMMALLALGRPLMIEVKIGIVGALLVILGGFSIHHRREVGRRWRGVPVIGVLGAVLFGLIGLFFLGLVVGANLPLNSATFPFFAGAASTILFGVLIALRVTSITRAEFERSCRSQGEDLTARMVYSREPGWKKAVRASFFLYFFAVSIASGCYY